MIISDTLIVLALTVMMCWPQSSSSSFSKQKRLDFRSIHYSRTPSADPVLAIGIEGRPTNYGQNNYPSKLTIYRGACDAGFCRPFFVADAEDVFHHPPLALKALIKWMAKM